MSHDQDRGFLKGINITAFLDVYQEWHAFVEGFCEVLCPWPAEHKLSGKLLDDLRGDHHYYVFGRAMGVIAWLIIAKSEMLNNIKAQKSNDRNENVLNFGIRIWNLFRI